MEIRSGVNTEWGRRKFDVTLDENDLKLLLAEHGIPLDAVLTLAEKFGLLYSECESYAKLIWGRLDPNVKAELQPEIAAHRASRDKILGKLREQHAP